MVEMKKNEVKKLRLSRETLYALTSSEAQKALGGTEVIGSCQTVCRPDTTPELCEDA
jgi:hypothetical protein